MFAQKAAYRVGFDALFDNIENCDRFYPAKTEFAVKLAPEIGLSFAKYHRIMVGANLLQNLGSSEFPTAAELIAYYRFDNRRFKVLAGIFSTSYRSKGYGRAFYEENQDFFNLNTSGLLLNHNSRSGFVELLCDWYLLDNEKQRDGFTLSGVGEYGFWDRYFLLGGAVLLNHFKDAEFLKDCSLLERFQYNIYVGSDFSGALPAMDRFRVTVGILGTAEHKRIKDVKTAWYNGMGVQVNLDLGYKGFNFTNECYWGSPQMIYYGQYGSGVYGGSPFYNGYFYDRAEVGYTYRWSFLKVQGALVFHCTDKQVAAQQVVRLSVNFDEIISRRR